MRTTNTNSCNFFNLLKLRIAYLIHFREKIIPHCQLAPKHIFNNITSNQLHRNKSPGLDAFTIDFYKAFWNDIENCLFDSIAFSFDIAS